MLSDLDHLEHDATCNVDVCVVGAGPAGITLGLELANQGLSCALLESGGFQIAAWSRELNRGRPSGYPSWPLTASRIRCVGGTSLRWHGWCRPLEPGDFHARPWIELSGWPMTFDEVLPWYRRAQQICHVGEYMYDSLDAWISDARVPVLRLPHTAGIDQRLYMFSPIQDFGAEYLRCLEESPLQGFVNATVTGVHCRRGGGRVDHVEARAPGGRRLIVRAQQFVIATGGIENARVLLAARARGLAWGGDWIGRPFIDHPHVLAGVLVPSRATDLRAYDAITAAPSGWGRLALALAAETAEQLRLPGATAILQPITVDKGSVVWAILARGEQVPNPSSHVALGSAVDCFGTPLPVVDWQLSRIDRAAIAALLERLSDAIEDVGIGAVTKLMSSGGDSWPADLLGGCHHIGTTRMATDVNRGVVDRDCRVFGTENLYAVGSSVFPTGGVANPTLTIVALAARLADHIATMMGNSRRPSEWDKMTGAVTAVTADPGDETESFLNELSTQLMHRVRLIVDEHERRVANE